MAKPHTLYGEPTAEMVDKIDTMLGELYTIAATSTHKLLSLTHEDTVASAAVRGSIITGQSVPPVWTALALGAANRFLRSDGVDASWGAVVLTSDVSGILPVANGGTAIASYAIGDILYASAAAVLSRLADVSAGSYLRSGGVGVAPLWSTLKVPNAATQGDIFYSDATNSMAALAKSASATRYLSNTGASNAPAWAQVALTTGVSGVLPEANGGTNQSTYASGDLLYASAANTLSKLAKGTNGHVLTLAAGLPSWAAAAGGGSSFTEQTTTSTGTQNDFSLSASQTYLRCNNASALVLNGFSVSGAAPAAGAQIVIDNIGTSTVKVAYQAGASTAAYRAITQSTTGQIIGAGGRMLAVYDDTTDRWRVTIGFIGAPIDIPYAGLAFTAGTGTWTVAAGDLVSFTYIQEGVLVTYAIDLSNSTVNAATGSNLIISESSLLPGGFTGQYTRDISIVRVAENAPGGAGTFAAGYMLWNSTAGLALQKADLTAWANTTDGMWANGKATIQVQ